MSFRLLTANCSAMLARGSSPLLVVGAAAFQLLIKKVVFKINAPEQVVRSGSFPINSFIALCGKELCVPPVTWHYTNGAATMHSESRPLDRPGSRAEWRDRPRTRGCVPRVKLGLGQSFSLGSPTRNVVSFGL